MQDGPLARFVAVGEMASLQGGENSSQAAVAAAAGAAAMAALTALSVGGDKGTAPAATHAHSAHLVSTSVGSLGAGPQQLRTHQAKSHSARSSPTQGPGMPSSGAAVAASRVASGAAREQGPEATDEWEEANARMHQQGQSHSSPVSTCMAAALIRLFAHTPTAHTPICCPAAQQCVVCTTTCLNSPLDFL